MATHHTPPAAHHRPLVLASVAVVLTLMLAGGVWALTRSSSPGRVSTPAGTSTPTAMPSPTPTSAPHTVYTANWSHGADGWALPPSVHTTSGHLVFDGTGTVTLTIPYQPPVTGYTIQMGMEIFQAAPTGPVGGGTITISGQDASGNSQFYAQLLCKARSAPGCHGGQSTVGTLNGQYPQGLEASDFSISPVERIYTVQVTDEDVRFCNGVACMPASFVTAPTVAVKLVLQDSDLQLVITSLVITTP
jgi:hypothetical protein